MAEIGYELGFSWKIMAYLGVVLYGVALFLFLIM